MTLHERLKQLRADTDWSQETFAAHIGISTPGYIKLENGQRLPSEKVITQIAGALFDKKTTLYAPLVASLIDELSTLKALGSKNPYIRKIAGVYVKSQG